MKIEGDGVDGSAGATEKQPGASSPEERLLRMLRAEFKPLYAILDASRKPDVLKLLVESKEEYQSLYEGASAGHLAHFAPYLVRLPAESPLLEALVRKGWGKSWGVYLTCDRPFQEVRRHLRHFLIVKTEDGRELYFRSYDPRVLRVFLPTCTPEEINQFFGPIQRYLMEDEKPDVLLTFGNRGCGAERAAAPLTAPGQLSAGTSSSPRSGGQKAVSTK